MHLTPGPWVHLGLECASSACIFYRKPIRIIFTSWFSYRNTLFFCLKLSWWNSNTITAFLVWSMLTFPRQKSGFLIASWRNTTIQTAFTWSMSALGRTRIARITIVLEIIIEHWKDILVSGLVLFISSFSFSQGHALDASLARTTCTCLLARWNLLSGRLCNGGCWRSRSCGWGCLLERWTRSRDIHNH